MYYDIIARVYCKIWLSQIFLCIFHIFFLLCFHFDVVVVVVVIVKKKLFFLVLFLTAEIFLIH